MKYDFQDSPYWKYTGALEALDKDYKIKKTLLKISLSKPKKPVNIPKQLTTPTHQEIMTP